MLRVVTTCLLFLALIAVTLALPRLPDSNGQIGGINRIIPPQQMCPKSMPMANNMIVPSNLMPGSNMAMMMQLSGDMAGTILNPSGEVDIMRCKCVTRASLAFRFPAPGKKCPLPNQRCLCGDTGLSVEGDQAMAYNFARQARYGRRGGNGGGFANFNNPLFWQLMGR